MRCFDLRARERLAELLDLLDRAGYRLHWSPSRGPHVRSLTGHGPFNTDHVLRSHLTHNRPSASRLVGILAQTEQVQQTLESSGL